MNMAIMGVIYATLILQHFFCTYIEIFYTPTSIQFKNALILKLMMVNEVCEVTKYFLSSVKIGSPFPFRMSFRPSGALKKMHYSQQNK